MKDTVRLVEFNGTSKEKANIDSIAKMCAKTLSDERHITVTEYSAIPTIAYEFLYTAAKFLEKNRSKDEDFIINIMNLIEMGVTYRESPEDSEKGGNFTPFVQAGTILKTVLKSDEDTEDE